MNPRAERLVEAADFLAREIAAILQEEHSTEIKVLAGALLFELGNRFKKLLDPIKEGIREEAGRKTEKTLILKGEGQSSCTVQYQVPQVRLRQYINEREIRKVLKDRFEEYFIETVTVTPVKDIQEKIAAADPVEASMVLSIIEVVPAPRRISFTRKP